MGRKYNLEARLESNRPPVTAGRLDQRLVGLALALRGVVAETQETFIYPAWQLDNDALDELQQTWLNTQSTKPARNALR